VAHNARHLPVTARCYTLNMSKDDDNGRFQIKATNRKAMRDFVVEERLEAGLVLTGSEIKSIRGGRASLIDSYAAIEGGEAWVYGMNISPYVQASHFGHEPTRVRKLLLHKDEIKRLTGKIAERGYPGAGEAVHKGRQGQARAGTRAGSAALRQAPRTRRARRQPRDRQGAAQGNSRGNRTLVLWGRHGFDRIEGGDSAGRAPVTR
jgi:SsrA-binding protein